MALLPAPPSSSNPLLRRSLQRRSSVQFKGTPPVTHIETQEAQNIGGPPFMWPLNSIELENWTNYLDFIEGECDLSKVVKLYERCLIACANYPEYWIRYVLCMEANRSMDIANKALARATQFVD
ncbi:hypothetical protein C1H46_002138 [Malus baccata]|uniref:BUB1 N-terminal domain-containing protein n=1 Tax=Malus baccata TaxID=106549 RepID=A0A540NNM7_MALBA|nr:hypothetical protein C1H46_002138 [Malus baccata]